MGSVEFRIEIYHHNSDNPSDWSFGCPELDLMGYNNLEELYWRCVCKKKGISFNNTYTNSKGDKE